MTTNPSTEDNVTNQPRCRYCNGSLNNPAADLSRDLCEKHLNKVHDGSGFWMDAEDSVCPKCTGQGTIIVNRSREGKPNTYEQCEACHGTGRIPTKKTEGPTLEELEVLAKGFDELGVPSAAKLTRKLAEDTISNPKVEEDSLKKFCACSHNRSTHLFLSSVYDFRCMYPGCPCKEYQEALPTNDAPELATPPDAILEHPDGLEAIRGAIFNLDGLSTGYLKNGGIADVEAAATEIMAWHRRSQSEYAIKVLEVLRSMAYPIGNEYGDDWEGLEAQLIDQAISNERNKIKEME